MIEEKIRAKLAIPEKRREGDLYVYEFDGEWHYTHVSRLTGEINFYRERIEILYDRIRELENKLQKQQKKTGGNPVYPDSTSGKYVGD